jgi:hypothetical protein
MKLTDLEPQFVKWVGADSSGRAHGRGEIRHVATLKQANGVMFLCPKCFRKNRGAAGTHGVICWNAQVPPAVEPGPGRWDMSGNGIDSLTLKGAGGRSDSVLLTSGCKWHGYVRDGDVTDA